MQAFSSTSAPLGKILALLECFDAEDLAGCDRLLAEFALPGIDRRCLNTCLVDALRWVNGNSEER
jgi:c-di-GMP-related signal transduction protein